MNLLTHYAILAVISGFSESFQMDSIDENINENRIFGGHTASPGQFPYQVSLRTRGRAKNMTAGWFRHQCGGSIISNRWILSAAHCTQDYYSNASWVTVAVGAHRIMEDGQIYILDRIVNHPAFIPAHLHNDLSLLRTVEGIQFNQIVQSVPLRRRFVDEGAKSIVSGWGQTEKQLPPWQHNPAYLQYLDQRTVTNDDCYSRHLPDYRDKVYNGTLCAIAQTGRGPCFGDSGGPLVSNGQLIGVVSWAHACAKGFPDGYTRVTAFLPWIKKVSGVVAV